MNSIRTRFAPSPTGFMHIGGVRTALFAWFIAKQASGSFILRIEDTDKSREVEGSVEHIIQSLQWLGIEWQEGPDIGGQHASYKQSERLPLYKQYAQQLLESGRAYVDSSNDEQVASWRKNAQLNKQPFLFRNHREEARVDEPWDGTKPLRFLSEPRRIDWHDEVRGDLTAGEVALDDFVIIKADGFPTYNFAHVVDDHEMQITHVVRGEEFIASTPKFIDLALALGFELPKYVTVPPILNQNGGKKLSKRDGARDVLEYKEDGYLPAAVINFLATMGWNDGTEQEVFKTEEIINSFDISRIQSSGARYDEERLKWLNGHHIRAMSIEVLYANIDAKYWPAASTDFDDTYKIQVLALTQERLKFFSELHELTEFFFKAISPTSEMLTKKLEPVVAHQYINATITTLANTDFTKESLEASLRNLVAELDAPTGKLFRLIRVSIVGGEIAPGLFETMEVLGKEEVLVRLRAADTIF